MRRTQRLWPSRRSTSASDIYLLLVGGAGTKRLRFPLVIGQGGMPFRTKRHIPNSMATLGRRFAVALAEACRDALAAARIIG